MISFDRSRSRTLRLRSKNCLPVRSRYRSAAGSCSASLRVAAKKKCKTGVDIQLTSELALHRELSESSKKIQEHVGVTEMTRPQQEVHGGEPMNRMRAAGRRTVSSNGIHESDFFAA
jgi:hypothetical protein